jgi:hypothetical protein
MGHLSTTYTVRATTPLQITRICEFCHHSFTCTWKAHITATSSAPGASSTTSERRRTQHAEARASRDYLAKTELGELSQWLQSDPVALANYGPVCPHCRRVSSKCYARNFPKGFRKGVADTCYTVPRIILYAILSALGLTIAITATVGAIQERNEKALWILSVVFILLAGLDVICVTRHMLGWHCMRRKLPQLTEQQLEAVVSMACLAANNTMFAVRSNTLLGALNPLSSSNTYGGRNLYCESPSSIYIEAAPCSFRRQLRSLVVTEGTQQARKIPHPPSP